MVGRGTALLGKVLEKKDACLSRQARVKSASKRGKGDWVTSGVPSQSLSMVRNISCSADE